MIQFMRFWTDFQRWLTFYPILALQMLQIWLKFSLGRLYICRLRHEFHGALLVYFVKENGLPNLCIPALPVLKLKGSPKWSTEVWVLLCCIVGDPVKTWDLILQQAEFAYDNSVNRTIKTTPFVAAYGHKPQHVFDLVPFQKRYRLVKLLKHMLNM